MAITKFKITRLPVRASLKLSGGTLPLNQEYHISQQAQMTVDVFDRGEPYDDFGFKLGNDNGDWSPEYNCTINALVDAGVPTITPVNISVPTAGTRDITADIVYTASTDRIVLKSITGLGYLNINGSRAIVGNTYYLYDFVNVIFVSIANIESQNEVTTVVLTPENGTQTGADANIVLTTSGNLRGVVDINNDELVTVTGTLIWKPSKLIGQINGSSTVSGTLIDNP